VPKGKRVALVGESGCGKSTVVKLIQRFYDIAEGSLVRVVGLQLKWKQVRNVNKRFVYILNYEICKI
jgi:ABC-type bacteriocin/lantibiotic exporter with double-glycine peptidase domain